MSTTTKKKPSAAEVARREAQSAADTDENILDITVNGIRVHIPADDLDDWDALNALGDNDPRPMLNLILPDPEDRKKSLDALREDSGKLRASAVMNFIHDVFEAVGKGNS